MTDKLIISEDDKLYTNNTGRKSFQWELWQYCNSLCKFCYLGKENRIHNKARQIQSLKDLSLSVEHLDYTKYNNISIIGGEFFQGQLDDKETHDLFFKVIKQIFQCYLDKKIGSMWITCTLTIGDQKHLYELMDLAEAMGVFPKEEYGASGLWLCTSWDAAGRFHTKQMEKNWQFHMKNIKKKYPWIKFNTTIILQKQFVEDYLSGKFVLKDFAKEYSTTFFFKQCGIPPAGFEPLGLEVNNGAGEKESAEARKLMYESKMDAKEEFQKIFPFFPTRKQFLKFLMKFHQEDRENFDRLFNIMYRSDELHRNFISNEHDITNVRQKTEVGPEENGKETLPCGHTETYAAYIDNDHCCICDRNAIAELD